MFGKIVNRLHARCGDFWWYAILIFFACRSGDAIQAFIGLWLVPHWVPQNELGATLPLLQVSGLFGLPIAILVIPFSRWLTLYTARGEYGKVKWLLRTVFLFSAAAFAALFFAAKIILPHFFDRMRIAEGSLGILVLCVGLIGPCSSVFCNALQGLKKFRALTIVNFAAAPFRLLVMLVAMPFRALSGYVLGQGAGPFITIVFAWCSLRRNLGGKIKSVAVSRKDLAEMAAYTLPLAIYVAAGSLLGTWQAMLVRQRLPEVESAAYYIITRLSDTAAYLGASLLTVVVPLVAEASERRREDWRLLAKLLLGTAAAGLAVSAVFASAGKWMLESVPLWSTYAGYWTLLASYSLRMAVCATSGSFMTYETAAGRFSFMWYWLPTAIVETGALAVLTGCSAFRGILPDVAVDFMESLHAGRLEFFVLWMLACSTVQLAAVCAHIAFRRKAARRGEA